ncbi:PREDICTED: canalicular multispecific organic anion transporter 2-like [Mandrillus leucophaeus]|uniref:canalicular multispecific organic anion transporter 2-like n=1 Tax=Mandrillus leucophaeus TaxID=9568 RepID=UPI0005F50341|nr:PREDICTED: canalicular multispecific organic anion transporter 2-like [Mandrillus leucophaeus]
MDTLCGSGELGSKFWDSNLSVHTDNPDLTPCFQNSLLAWVPCIYLWVALPCYLLYLRYHGRGYIILSHLSRLKTVSGPGISYRWGWALGILFLFFN